MYGLSVLQRRCSSRMPGHLQTFSWLLVKEILKIRLFCYAIYSWDWYVSIHVSNMSINECQGMDAYLCVGRNRHGDDHVWVMTREPDGSVIFWETLLGVQFKVGVQYR